MMLTTTTGFKKVFLRYSNIDQAFQCVVSAKEWENVENVSQLFEIFNEVYLDLITLLPIFFYKRYGELKKS